jgi:hypothetical protein
VKFKAEEGEGEYFLVIPYCHRYNEGYSAYEYSNVERVAPVCQRGSSSTNNIDYWHYYYGAYGQDKNYGRNHWPQINQNLGR